MDVRDFKNLRTSTGFRSEVDFAITCMPPTIQLKDL